MDKRDCIYLDCLVVTDYGSACEHWDTSLPRRSC